MKKQDIKKEYRENRISWRFLNRIFAKDHDIAQRMNTLPALQVRVLLEILKELQYMNDKSSPPK